MIKRKIGFLLFDGVNSLDLVGPLEAFYTVGDVSANSPYECVFIGEKRQKYVAESGLPLFAEVSIDQINALDTLIVPGGGGVRDPHTQAVLGPWLTAMRPACRRIVSVCTGAFLLASCGLLNGRKATTHWAFIAPFRDMYPKVELVPDELYVDNGDIATSAGITSGIDLSLKLIEDDLGADIASQVARYLVVHFRRAGDQAQFSAPLKYQIKADSKFASLTGWILENIDQHLSIEKLAEHCGMSERHFCRRFTEQMGQPPARFVEDLRMDYARQLLVEKSWPISRIGEACGYTNIDVFRRAFERRYRISASAYRARFVG